MDGRDLYWVEAITNYHPTAVRFLATSNPPPPSVITYDPRTAKGPLIKVGDSWYWDDRFCLEVMLDTDLAIRNCSDLDIVAHHPRYCNQGGCREQAELPDWAAAHFLAFLLGENHTILRGLPTHTLRNQLRLLSHFENGLSRFCFDMADNNPFSGPIMSGARASTVVSAAFAAYGRGDSAQAKKLVRLLGSEARFLAITQSIVRDYVNEPTLVIPDPW